MDMQGLTSLVPLLVMGAIFYFMIFRPQKVQEKKRKELLDSLKRGDKIVTIGGIFGTIQKLDEQKVWLEVAELADVKEKVVIVISRKAVSQIQNEAEPEA